MRYIFARCHQRQNHLFLSSFAFPYQHRRRMSPFLPPAEHVNIQSSSSWLTHLFSYQTWAKPRCMHLRSRGRVLPDVCILSWDMAKLCALEKSGLRFAYLTDGLLVYNLRFRIIHLIICQWIVRGCSSWNNKPIGPTLKKSSSLCQECCRVETHINGSVPHYTHILWTWKGDQCASYMLNNECITLQCPLLCTCSLLQQSTFIIDHYFTSDVQYVSSWREMFFKRTDSWWLCQIKLASRERITL